MNSVRAALTSRRLVRHFGSIVGATSCDVNDRRHDSSLLLVDSWRFMGVSLPETGSLRGVL